MGKVYTPLFDRKGHKISIFFCLLFLTTISAFSQITIGSGTSTQRFPFNYYFGYGRTATIYNSSEMNTTSVGGTITTISWYSNIASSVTGPTVIFLKQVGVTTAVASDTWANTITGATQVYTGTPAAWNIGWNTIDITDYAIAANQNLEILVECNYSGTGTGTITGTAFRYTAGATGSNAYWQADNAAPTSTPTINTSRPNVILAGLAPFACPSPTSVSVGSITANSASITFTATGSSFIVEYGATGFTPGTGATAGTGGAIVTGTTSPITISGLTPSTSYQVYIRQNCTGAGNGYSLNSAVTSFTTTVACAAPTAVSIGSITTTSASVNFTSTGTAFIVEYGPANFTPGTGTTAGTGGTIVTGTTSPITISGLISGTTYDVYVRQNCTSAGNGYSGNSTKGTFSTACTAVTTFSENFDASTNLPACFRKVGAGGSANVQASSASSSPNTLYIYSGSTSSQAVVALPPVSNAGAGTNQLRFKLRGNFTAGDTLQVGYLTNIADSSTFVVLNQARAVALTYTEYAIQPGTAPGSNQYLAFRAKGSFGYSMLIDDIYWEAIPACPTPSGVSIGSVTFNSASVNFTSTGSSFIVEYSTSNFTPGTGATAGTGSTLVTGTSSPISLTGLAASTKYYVYLRQNCSAAGNGYSTNVFVDSFTTAVPPPVNDLPSGATTLTVDAGCTGATYTNVGATASTGEPFPSCSGTVQAPVWFKFVAPANGAVRVSTDVGSGNTFTDSKIALFSATDPSNLSTFSIISCDDDGGSVLGSGFMSVLYATGLTSGTTYYVAVDKYFSSTTNGTFCVTVSSLDSSMISRTNTCSSTLQTPGSGGAGTTYTGWVPLLDASSKLVALVQNPAGGAVSAYSVSQNVNTGAVRNSQGTYYLDRNFRISNSASAANVNVQLFFLISELTALQAVDPLITLANMGVTRQTEATAGCSNNFDTARGPISFIAQTGNGTAGQVSWINFRTPGFSNFYLHRNGTALPIKFEYLTGKKAGSTNALNWKVTCTSTSITMVLERSADARTFNQTVTSINATQARCGQPFDAVDAAPLNGISYYRLKMIDVDGKVSYSPVAAVLNGKAGAELVGIYPTVVKDQAYLSITSSRNTTLQFSISDVSGKVIKTINQAVSSGSAMLPISTSNLASGVYNISGMLDGVRTQTLRFVKQ